MRTVIMKMAAKIIMKKKVYPAPGLKENR